ncbi:MAG: response regulator [Gammaproteobacteria bacterium]|jgi:CheY-like chemotaxis protein
MCKQILIVDDQDAIRELLRLTLASFHDCKLYEADNSDEAMRLINDVRPDLVLLDVMLPGTMDGYQLCERIKSNAQTRSIVVVLLTARAQQSDIEKGGAVGADDYIVKPFSPGQLKQRITEICDNL